MLDPSFGDYLIPRLASVPRAAVIASGPAIPAGVKSGPTATSPGACGESPNDRGALVFVQYGDFREDASRLAQGGPETYQSQRASVDYVVGLCARGWRVCVVNLATQAPFDENLACGARVIGLGPSGFALPGREWRSLLDELAPERLIVRTPLRPALSWAKRRRCRTLVTLADSFHGNGLRAILQRWRLRRLLAGPNVEFVANHGRNASFQLARMGIPQDKIVPWDWAPSMSPREQPPKGAIAGGRPVRLLYAGGLFPGKGVDDLLRAVRILADEGREVRLSLLGKGDEQARRALAASLALDGLVEFVGLVPNAEVAGRMRDADVVVVPSRPEYPEGLPMTIYEALCARTPIVASNHPMFVGNLVDGESALIFPAGEAEALARAIARLIDEPAIYEALSLRSAAAWERLQLPVKWIEMIERWLNDDLPWLARHSLASGIYEMNPIEVS